MAFLLKNSLRFAVASHLLRSRTTNIQNLSSASAVVWQKANVGDSETGGSNTQKKSKASVKITLIQNQNVTVTALEEARNLAKRRSMHLVQVQKMDTKTQRPVYKLVSAAEHLQEELSDLKAHDKDGTSPDKPAQKKSEKTLNIGSRISEHDLASRLKNISKWLDKRHEVRILIQGTEGDMAGCEKIYKAIEESIKTPETIGKIVQKRAKGSVIKFNILPVNNNASEKSATNNPNQ
ncbi:translation initiation factor IF-3 [Stomoxys calcitrans]|uniref:Translation initiation factor 3 N-terminal domain-containing protein n=1 Tax=Stomoxys calcitrans TaxID=35570 RepID=A0A1I8NNI0_STOCA|nr:translation initiation factor IF-3 [Stomoxys calcitrans]